MRNHDRKERDQEITGGALPITSDAHTLQPHPRRDGVGAGCGKGIVCAGAAPDMGSVPF